MWRKVVLILGAVIICCLCFGCGLTIGLFSGMVQYYKQRYLEEKELVAPILASDPAFSRVELEPRPGGGILLFGAVPTSDDKDRLRDKTTRAVGERRAREIVRGVDSKK